jgi:hypothetical protein
MVAICCNKVAGGKRRDHQAEIAAEIDASIGNLVEHDAHDCNRDGRESRRNPELHTDAHEHVGEARTEHVKLAMRKVRDAEHPEHKCQSKRNERVAAPERESVDDLLGQHGEHDQWSMLSWRW